MFNGYTFLSEKVKKIQDYTSVSLENTSSDVTLNRYNFLRFTVKKNKKSSGKFIYSDKANVKLAIKIQLDNSVCVCVCVCVCMP